MGAEAAYARAGYVRAVAGDGEPRALPASGAWLVCREVPGAGGALDAMGPYPLLACADWDALAGDLAACEDLVSVVAVPDPHGGASRRALEAAFPDRLVPYKEHFVTDLRSASVGTRHHRYYARRALRSVEVVEAPDPAAHLDEWTALYGHLADRHALSGGHAFPREAFAAMLAVPGAVLLRAVEGERAVAAHLWYLTPGGVAYSHLAASSPRGYELSAAYALHAAAAGLLRDRAELLHLGGSAGAGARDGLAAFKAGWATGSVTALLAGRIGDRERYAALSGDGRDVAAGHFPAYRGA